MNKIYIAGKVTGLPKDEVIQKFAEAQKQFEAYGYEVVNPIEVVNDWEMEWKEAMKLCIAALMECDAIYLLNDYKESKGALLEKQIAKAMNIKNIVEYKYLA